ncbi:MAG: hypothetical protein D8H97_30025, partial [Neisseria sp.]
SFQKLLSLITQKNYETAASSLARRAKCGRSQKTDSNNGDTLPPRLNKPTAFYHEFIFQYNSVR